MQTFFLYTCDAWLKPKTLVGIFVDRATLNRYLLAMADDGVFDYSAIRLLHSYGFAFGETDNYKIELKLLNPKYYGKGEKENPAAL